MSGALSSLQYYNTIEPVLHYEVLPSKYIPCFASAFLTHPIPNFNFISFNSPLFTPISIPLRASLNILISAILFITPLTLLQHLMARLKTSAPNASRRKSAPKSPANVEALEAARDKAKEDHRLAKKTTKNYNRYVARGKDFLRELVRSMEDRLKAITTLSAEERTSQHSDLQILSKAFDETPNTQSVRALELYITQKCFTEGCGGNTASGIHAGFKNFWNKKSIFSRCLIGCFSDNTFKHFLDNTIVGIIVSTNLEMFLVTLLMPFPSKISAAQLSIETKVKTLPVIMLKP